MKIHLFFKKFVAFLLLANLLVLPLMVNFTHVCCEEPYVDLQHNTHCHDHGEAKPAFAKKSEFKSQLCYACIYSSTLSVISPTGTHLVYSVVIETLNPFTEQIFTSSFQTSHSGRGPPSVMA